MPQNARGNQHFWIRHFLGLYSQCEVCWIARAIVNRWACVAWFNYMLLMRF